MASETILEGSPSLRVERPPDFGPILSGGGAPGAGVGTLIGTVLDHLSLSEQTLVLRTSRSPKDSCCRLSSLRSDLVISRLNLDETRFNLDILKIDNSIAAAASVIFGSIRCPQHPRL